MSCVVKVLEGSELFGTQVIETKEVSAEKPKNELEVLKQYFGLEINEEEIAEIELGHLVIEVDKSTGEFKKIRTSVLSQHEKLRHRLVAFLMARGFTNEEISSVTGYNSGTVSSLLSKPHIRGLAVHFMDKITEKIGLDKNLALSMLGGKSLEAAEKIIEKMKSSTDEKVSLHAAKLLLEAVGAFEKKDHTEKNERDQLVQLIIQNNDKAQVNVAAVGSKKTYGDGKITNTNSHSED